MSETPSGFRAGFVAVVGRPNVGKSTLVNALVGQKIAIVSDKPQTTRNRILAVVNWATPPGQIVLLDTPGIHKPSHKMNQRMVDLALRSLEQTDVVLWLIDLTQSFGPGDRYVAQVLGRCKKPIVLGINKIDALPKPKILSAIETYRGLLPFADIVPVSALKGENTDVLARQLLTQLAEGPPLYPDDFLTDQPERFFVAEMVREAILKATRDEIPYVAGVLIESFKEEGELVRIHAQILVERDSQKGILIGKGGSMLKAIGTTARHQIENFLGSKVFLGLFVVVRPDWREDVRTLKEMGLLETSEE